MVYKIAVLITCHNRREKTIACLSSFYNVNYPPNYNFDIFLVDDGSTDNTYETVKSKFPKVKIIIGNGNLYWAGGMRLAWNKACEISEYKAFLLLNDDVTLFKDYFINLLICDEFAINNYNIGGVYISSTKDPVSNKLTYGGLTISNLFFKIKFKRIFPSNKVLTCQITNANILWVSNDVVKKIGFFDIIFTHGIADYDYSYTAYKAKFPVLIAPNYGGYCIEDHGNNWKPSNSTIKERIKYLYSPKGLAFPELIKFYKKHFVLQLPYIFMMLWLKTLLPFIWENFKK